MPIPPPRIGWPLLPLPDEGGRLRWPDLHQSIEQHLRVLLLTRPGEQLMRPTFGIGLQRFVHRPDTVTTRAEIREAVLEGLARWERRILVESVEVMSDPARPGNVRVELRYRVRRNAEPHQLGLTLALESP